MVDATLSRVRLRDLVGLGRSRAARPGGAGPRRPSAARRRTGTDGAAIAAGTSPRPSAPSSRPGNRRFRGINHLAAYAATARRVLARERARDLPGRLRGGEERLVFVVGSPRSGTTFLAGAIGAVPGFADLTEVTPLKAAIPELVLRPESEAAAGIRRILERVRALALVRGARCVEQTPETAFVLGAALRAYPQGRALHVVRDGRDVVCSLLERGWLSAGRAGGDDARLSYGAEARFWVEPERRVEFESASDAARAAWAWSAYVRAARSVHERVFEIRYEALAESALRIAEQLGIEHRPLEQSLGRFHDRSIGRFRRDLSPEQLADVERIAGPLLRELGYGDTDGRLAG